MEDRPNTGPNTRPNTGPTDGPNTGPLIFLIAGEPSGDQLGAGLMSALRAKGSVRFAGVGGPLMEKEGLSSLFPMAELSVMGLIEVLPHVPSLMGRLRQTVAAVHACRPAVVVTIDSPGFNFRLARRLKGLGIPLVHYVAPSVWAWRPGRARKVAEFLDHLMALLPFEPPYFEVEGLPTTFVGHPVLESGLDRGDGIAFRRRHNIPAQVPVICVLPGSRLSETRRLLPIFKKTLANLKDQGLDFHVVVPTLGHVSAQVTAAVKEWPVPTVVIIDSDEKADAFAAATVALAASGTVALELAMAGVPAVIAYQMNPISTWLSYYLVQVRFVNLVNIILNREAVPEFIRGDCRPPLMAEALKHLLDDKGARQDQTDAIRDALDRLGLGGPSASECAAGVVLDVIDKSSLKER